MVEAQLVARSIRDPLVLEAMRRVPRERFVPARLRALAYADRALPIACGQTISQPYMVARTLELARLRPGARVLDVGTGSGYQAAVLAELGAEVVSIERLEALGRDARARLRELGYPTVEVVIGDGSLGWPRGAPYDAIVCAAAAPALPPAWREQLRVGGRAVAPIGDRRSQRLTVVVRASPERFEASAAGACAYVPLVGEQGFEG